MAAPSKIEIQDFSGGWNPSQDAFNAPPNVFLRADNLVWDETGVVRLRNGSVAINSTAFAGTVSQMFTTVLNGSRVRMTGAGSSMYENGTLLSASGSGAGDFSFGSHMGQILGTKGSLKKKWDGTTLRDWGIPDPASAPTAVQDLGNSQVIDACRTGWAVDTSEGTFAYVAGYEGTAAGAMELTPDAGTFRGVASVAFAVEDLDDYSGEAGSDYDLVELYIKITGSNLLASLSVQLDANGSSSAPFQDDYYQTILDLTSAVKVTLTADQAVASRTVEGFERDRVRRNIRTQDEDPEDGISTTRVGRAASWVRVSVPRGKWERVGSTTGKNWSTIVGARLIAQFTATGGKVAIDEITISGGVNHALTGSYRYRYVHVFNSGLYQGKSGLSPASEPLDIRAGGAVITTPASTSADVNETWVYMIGGGLDRFYRIGVISGNGGNLTAGISEVEAAILDIVTENNSPPPDSIIGIVGPHAARTWVLTATTLYPSRRNNPDSFDLTQGITVGDATETAFWVVLTTEGSLFVGTSKSLYSISGYGLEYPDGTTDFVKRTVAVEPPIDAGVTTDGYVVFYVASDGWRALAGGVSKRIVGTLDLLYLGDNRYGINAVNMGSAHARFRCAFLEGKLFALSGEGVTGNEDYSPALHVFDMQSPRRERRVYPFNIASIYREPDGKILAGCTDGFVRQLEIGNADGVEAIDLNIISPLYTGDTPLNFKDPFGMELHSDTGGKTITVALLVDAQTTSLFSTTFASSQMQAVVRRIDTLTPFRSVQAQITGNTGIFVLREFTFNYRLRPQRRLYVDTGYIDSGRNLNTWVRRIRLKARIQSQLTFIAYFDDVAFGPYTTDATAPIDKVTHFQIPLPKNYKGRQPRIVIYAADNVPVVPPTAERMRIDEFSAFPSVADLDAAERMRFATVGFSVAAVDGESDNSFEAYWLELTYAPTGAESEARVERVSIG